MPVTRFVAPGPERRHRDRGAPGEPAIDVGHERGALLVAGRDVPDGLRARERLEEVEGLLARDGEDELARLGFEAGDEEVGGGSQGRLGHAPECRGERLDDRGLDHLGGWDSNASRY